MLLRSSEGQYWEEKVITLKFLEIHKLTLRFSLRGDLGKIVPSLLNTCKLFLRELAVK